MKLDELTDASFDYHVDIIAISLDESTPEMNDRIRNGGSFQKITESLRNIVSIRKERGLTAQYMNFVFTAMRDNYH